MGQHDNYWIPNGVYTYAIPTPSIFDPAPYPAPPTVPVPVYPPPVPFEQLVKTSEDDKLDFIQPLLKLGLKPIDAIRLFCRCEENTFLATVIAALVLRDGGQPSDVMKKADDAKWLKAACKSLRRFFS